jgi:hypothetical protein
MGRVVVAMDPRKRSATIEVMDAEESVLGGGRFGTDAAGHAAMKEYAERWPDRVWAIGGATGAPTPGPSAPVYSHRVGGARRGAPITAVWKAQRDSPVGRDHVVPPWLRTAARRLTFRSE